MIKYESDGDKIIKCTNKGIETLEDPIEELNQQQILIFKMASLLQSISKGTMNPGIRMEAKDLAGQVKGEM